MFIIRSTICLIWLLHGWSGVCQAREAAMTVQGKLVDSQRRKGKGNTRNSGRPCIIELASSAPFLVDYVRPIFHFYNIWWHNIVQPRVHVSTNAEDYWQPRCNSSSSQLWQILGCQVLQVLWIWKKILLTWQEFTKDLVSNRSVKNFRMPQGLLVHWLCSCELQWACGSWKNSQNGWRGALYVITSLKAWIFWWTGLLLLCFAEKCCLHAI